VALAENAGGLDEAFRVFLFEKESYKRETRRGFSGKVRK